MLSSFRLFYRATADRDFDFARSYREIPRELMLWGEPPHAPQDDPAAPRAFFPRDMLRFANTEKLTSASWFLFRDGIKPIYDDPANCDGGEYSVYFAFADMDTCLAQIAAALQTDTLLRPDIHALDPRCGINGISVVPKNANTPGNNVTVKFWVHSRSAFKARPATEVFRPEHVAAWKLHTAIYLPFKRDHVTAPRGGGVGGGKHATTATASSAKSAWGGGRRPG